MTTTITERLRSLSTTANSDETGGLTNIAGMIKALADHFIIADRARLPDRGNGE